MFIWRTTVLCLPSWDLTASIVCVLDFIVVFHLVLYCSLLWWQLSIELEQELGNAKIILSVSALENLSDNGMGMVHTILPQEHEE